MAHGLTRMMRAIHPPVPVVVVEHQGASRAVRRSQSRFVPADLPDAGRRVRRAAGRRVMRRGVNEPYYAPTPVEHHQVSGWVGGPGECGVECSCGVVLDGFDTLGEAEQCRVASCSGAR